MWVLEGEAGSTLMRFIEEDGREMGEERGRFWAIAGTLSVWE